MKQAVRVVQMQVAHPEWDECVEMGFLAALSFVHQRAGEGEAGLQIAPKSSKSLEGEASIDVDENRMMVYCAYCHKTHSVLPTEEPCAPGAWIDHRIPSAQRAGEPPTPDEVERAALKQILNQRDTEWATDPSSMDQRFVANHYAAKLERIFVIARAALDAARQPKGEQ